MRGLVTALTFLTRVPFRADATRPADLGPAVPWFPLVGAGIGLAVAAVLAGAGTFLPPLAAAVMALVFGLLLTGALHEDGLADTFDGLGGGRTPGEALAIMRDSRLGTFGAAALTLALLVRAVLLAEALAVGPLLVVPAAHALSRAATVGVMLRVPPARATGLGAAYLEEVPVGRGALSIALTLAATTGMGGLAALAAAAAGFALAGGMGWWARRRIGGVTGDVLGACQQVAEVAVLSVLLLAVPFSFSG